VSKCLFPGSFDPFTLGHADLVKRALSLFDTVIIAVGINERKPGWIPVKERVRAMRAYYAEEPRIEVIQYEGLTAEIARKLQVDCILRGVRSVQDYEYEMQISDVNRHLTGIDTVLLFAMPQLSCISSSMVRELAHFGHYMTEWIPAGLNYKLDNTTYIQK